MPKGEWEKSIRRRLNAIKSENLLRRIGEEVILPAYGRNYRAANVKKESGKLLAALTAVGAPGNVFRIEDSRLITGVDYNTHRHFKWFIEGRAGFRAKTRKGLWFINLEGRLIRVHRVRRAPSHPNLFKLDSDDRRRINLIWREAFNGKGFIRTFRRSPVTGEEVVISGVR